MINDGWQQAVEAYKQEQYEGLALAALGCMGIYILPVEQACLASQLKRKEG